MIDLLWLLIPLAALSGWIAANRSNQNHADRSAPSIPDDYIKGLNFLLNEQPDKALEVFIRIVEVDSDTVETHIVLGNLFRRRGEVDRAIRIRQNLIARPHLDPGHRANALLELAKDYLCAGLLDRAENLFKEVIHIGGNTSQAYRHLREIYEQEKDWHNAIDIAVRWQQECGVPQAEVVAHYYCELGEAEILNQQHSRALLYAQQALDHDPDCARASILLGDLAFMQANYRSAIQFYSDVHQQKPDFIPVVLPKLGEAFARCGDDIAYRMLLQRMRSLHGGLSLTLDLVNTLRGCKGSDADDVLCEEMTKPLVSLKMVKEYISVKLETGQSDAAVMRAVANALDAHVERQASHICHRCGLETRALYWQCPGCHGWGTVKPVDHINGAPKPAPDPARAKKWLASAGD